MSRVEIFLKQGIGRPPNEPKEYKSFIGTGYMIDGTERFPKPETLVPGLIFKGGTTLLAGAVKQGKTWMALYVARLLVEEMDCKVLYLDHENGREIISQRVEQMSNNTAAWGRNFHYVCDMSLTQDQDSLKEFCEELDEVTPTLVVFDSLSGFLGSAGLSEDKADDVKQWEISYLRAVRDRQITTLILDHVGHGSEKRSRGSSRKREMVDTICFFKRVEAFSKSSVGEVSIILQEDRRGATKGVQNYRIGGEKGKFVMEPLRTERFGLKGQKLKMIDVLITEGKAGLSHKKWMDACVAKGMSQSTFKNYVSDLAEHTYGSEPIVEKKDDKYFPVNVDSIEEQLDNVSELFTDEEDLEDQDSESA